MNRTWFNSVIRFQVSGFGEQETHLDSYISSYPALQTMASRSNETKIKEPCHSSEDRQTKMKNSVYFGSNDLIKKSASGLASWSMLGPADTWREDKKSHAFSESFEQEWSRHMEGR